MFSALGLVASADFRKFDDGLRMTPDYCVEFAEKLKPPVAEAGDHAPWGVFRQGGSAGDVLCSLGDPKRPCPLR
jgi:hypothetical protein